MAPYYIYLDSKIVGAARQIVTFFENEVFSRDNTTILVKKYKHHSSREIGKIFELNAISYRFVLANDLDALEKGIIFYPFNAQSNCRAVANRKLKHIFITHGESNKVASVKPIIRIYDYVVTAGQAGIDRYLENGIFSQYDVDSGRIIPMGDTFIGRTGLSTNKNGEEVILYAPTWEGGIESENYSSLAYSDRVVTLLKEVAYSHNVSTILIKPHPNTGSRLPEYRQLMSKISVALMSAQSKLRVLLYSKSITPSFWERYKWRKLGIILIDDLSEYQAKLGVCDISAMETQLLNEDILYYQCGVNFPSSQMAYYQNALIDLQKNDEIKPLDKTAFNELKQHIIDQKFTHIPISDRISNLLTQLRNEEKQ